MEPTTKTHPKGCYAVLVISKTGGSCSFLGETPEEAQENAKNWKGLKNSAGMTEPFFVLPILIKTLGLELEMWDTTPPKESFSTKELWDLYKKEES